MVKVSIIGVLEPMAVVFTMLLSIMLKREGWEILKVFGVLSSIVGALVVLCNP
jgi:hypothetical protein